jgi:thioredoxin 1
MEITLTDDNFDSEVLNSDKPILVDFWAPWCGPCQMVRPAVAQIAEEMKDAINVGKLNVDENPQSSQKYQIFSIPSLKVFKEGKIIGEMVGALPKSAIEQKVKEILSQ